MLLIQLTLAIDRNLQSAFGIDENELKDRTILFRTRWENVAGISLSKYLTTYISGIGVDRFNGSIGRRDEIHHWRSQAHRKQTRVCVRRMDSLVFSSFLTAGPFFVTASVFCCCFSPLLLLAASHFSQSPLTFVHIIGR